jgi:hypothetical protein
MEDELADEGVTLLDHVPLVLAVVPGDVGPHHHARVGGSQEKGSSSEQILFSDCSGTVPVDDSTHQVVDREGGMVLLLEDILWTKQVRLHVEDVMRVHEMKPQKK